ncbi:Gfo/Idh/MocA family oxidoreductase [Fulvivirgaceae bacterium PWU4]|uniref:Gfo/Idh/MocA family oxidoreductase n=1 Tax=Chryseosolibacter histidini TaxID=2782349 RepID=A0AAP2GIP0_9BACT|nr:Gfo/Idh/MocA family oxidoreductase [Chryseosolibacter histidini]MBT1697209.1 Gfo/Idh/MocA family oxidoreductase [Chryseosolibacter histidini]
MSSTKKINRRQFIGSATTASLAFTIVPRHVIGGPDFVAPSDKLTLGYIGCGTQGMREMTSLIANPKIRIVAVCDPNKKSTDYVDWSPTGIRDGIRKALEDPTWGEAYNGIPGGRDIGQEFVEKYYAKDKTTQYKGCASYEDYRELLEKEKDIDALKIMTPDHLHATISIAAMKKGKHVVIHKPIANRMYETKLTIDTARKTGVSTHLLAWSKRSGNDVVKKWISDGAIGTLKEIHNWSYRPVWPQWTTNPQETPAIPKDFNWDLWLGPVPDRPYHPNYTHCVFRGWYDFGGGSIADMGHYSLWPLFLTLGINTPAISAEAYGTTTRQVIDHVSRNVVNDVAFPYSSIIRFKFAKQETLPAFDLFWYDGGMKPHTPEELEVDGKDLPQEGMMFVGDKGKILAGFRCDDPVLIPEARMKQYTEGKEKTGDTNERGDDVWIDAFKNKKQSPGSFLYASAISETINLGAVALRARKKVLYDSAKMEITNVPEANKFLRREYRKGWEL